MINLTEAIYKLNPTVVTIRGDIAYDAQDNEVTYNKAAVAAKAIELQTEEAAKKQAQVDAKQTALNKLMALGLTEEEALALGIK
jgi:hypothetical protein